jgi:hypothetical protein
VPLHAKLPTWLMAVIFTVVFVAVVAGIYWLVGSSHDSGSSAAPNAAANAAPANGGKASPMQKYIEVVGVRFVEDPKDKTKAMARFIVVNHSEADVSGLAGTVTVAARTDKSQVTAGSFTFSTNLGPFQSKEMTEPLNTALKIYELPDWQFVHADVQITAPQQ